MKIVLDNCMPYRAKRLLVGHEVSHAKDVGWQELVNGKLLAAAAAAELDVVMTIDKRMRFEQNLDALPVRCSRSTRPTRVSRKFNK